MDSTATAKSPNVKSDRPDPDWRPLPLEPPSPAWEPFALFWLMVLLLFIFWLVVKRNCLAVEADPILAMETLPLLEAESPPPPYEATQVEHLPAQPETPQGLFQQHNLKHNHRKGSQSASQSQ